MKIIQDLSIRQDRYGTWGVCFHGDLIATSQHLGELTQYYKAAKVLDSNGNLVAYDVPKEYRKA